MNLAKLFETQRVLRDRIGYNEPDRFEKLILALLVEIGECANEWRGFKFWSKDQEPRTKVLIPYEEGVRDGGLASYKNLLLEEYVDSLHFLLEIGLELKYTNLSLASYETPSIEYQFNEVISACCKVRESVELDWQEEEKQDEFDNLCMGFIGLGRMLGFTWEEIEAAYYSKNQVNHERQSNGY